MPAIDELPDIANSLCAINITAIDVYEALISLDISKSACFDNISPKVLQSCAEALCEPIHHLIVEIKTYTEHHNWNSQSKLTSYTINTIAVIQLNSLLEHSLLGRCYILVVTWALVICLICMPSALGLWAYISGKSLVPMLQLLHKQPI